MDEIRQDLHNEKIMENLKEKKKRRINQPNNERERSAIIRPLKRTAGKVT
ncbi:MAG: hypothetical protein Ct9H300mP3_06860 [Gammaproteobacteria bacterium]|nr:MAG: hypothetical protein Ct9H300mP3_06860 [Gammaproteobacteria bacterium]